jgi:hypothetical protein
VILDGTKIAKGTDLAPKTIAVGQETFPIEDVDFDDGEESDSDEEPEPVEDPLGGAGSGHQELDFKSIFEDRLIN